MTPQPTSSPPPGTLLLRADASNTIGAGHVMRCIALAQAWVDAGGQAVFALAEGAREFADRLKREGFTLVDLGVQRGSDDDARRTVGLADQHGAAAVVIDGYCFGDAYLQTVADGSGVSLLIDDFSQAGHYPVDLVLNQSPAASAAMYPSRGDDTELLLGLRHLLLRREFLSTRPAEADVVPRARRILVTLGGGDADNVTAVVLEGLSLLKVEDLDVLVVAGPANPHAEDLLDRLDEAPYQAELICDTDDMPALMREAHLAICGGGSTCYELAYLGTPAAAVILAENQMPVVAACAQAGCVEPLGWFGHLTPPGIAAVAGGLLEEAPRRAAMSRAGRLLVDGRGSRRVVRAILSAGMELRKVTAADVELVYEWANDPAVREVSFRSEPIAWETHRTWFADKLSDDACLWFIAQDATGRPIGQIRFDRDGDSATVSIALGSQQRGRGYGAALVRRGTQRAAAAGIRTVHAWAKPQNAASIAVFRSVGYETVGEETVHDQPAVHLRWTAPDET